MTTPSFVEGNTWEEYDSEDYFNCIEAAPDSNLVESVYYNVFPDVLIDEYVPVPAHAAPTFEADVNAIEQSVVVDAVEADATLESEIAVEESIVAQVVEADATLGSEIAVEESIVAQVVEGDATLESEIAVEGSIVAEVVVAVEADVTLELEFAVEEEEDTMSEWSEEEDEDVISEFSEEAWVDSEDEDMISEASEEASEDEAWVADEEGFTIPDLAESNAPFEEETQIAHKALHTPFEVGTGAAIEESGEEAVEAITTVVTIPAATSTSLVPMLSTSSVIEATGDSTVPTHDWEAFFGCSPMVMLQECRTTLLTVVENFFIEVERFRIRLRRFINSVMGKWEATTTD